MKKVAILQSNYIPWKSYAEGIVGTITAIDAFMGAVLGISTVQYNKTLDK